MTAVRDLEMAHVAAGNITLRDDRTGRTWSVALKPYWVGRYPVTNRLFHFFAGLGPSATPLNDHPVVGVSWLDAAHFCNQLSRAEGFAEPYVFWADGLGADLVAGSSGYRLLSEAEWQYACCAGVPAPRYGEPGAIAWYAGNSGGSTRPVGGREPNARGLYDMLGNVWEWCSDQYDPVTYGPYRTFRGGGWADAARGCLSTNRRRSHPAFQIDDLGFRLGRSA